MSMASINSAEKSDTGNAMKKRLVFYLVLFAFLALAGFLGLVWLTAPAHRINSESMKSLKQGMTEKEVEDLFGVPPGDYEKKDGIKRIYPVSDLFIPAVPCEKKEWKGGGWVITVWFDAEGKLFHWSAAGAPDRTFLDKVREFLHIRED